MAELRAGELGYGVLDVESRFSVEENVACSCFSREGRLEALQLGFTPTSRSSNTRETQSTREHENITSCGKQILILQQGNNQFRYIWTVK